MSIHIIKGVQTKGVPKFPRDMSENNDKICNPTFDQNKLKTIPFGAAETRLLLGYRSTTWGNCAVWDRA